MTSLESKEGRQEFRTRDRGRMAAPASPRASASHVGVVQSLRVAGHEKERLIAGANGQGGGLGLGSLFGALRWSPGAKAAEGEENGSEGAAVALTTLGLMWESATAGSERWLLCDCVRSSGSVPRLVALIRHPEV